jgi:intein/homing endonuclease
MVLEYGPVEKLKSTKWYMAELRSDKTVEPTMKRLGREVGGIFRDEPLEVFIPVQRRDLDVFELGTVQYVFVRSTSFPALLRLKQITGICGLVTEGDCNRPSKAIFVDDSYVQSLISLAEEEHRQRAIGIEVGSFVRILNGECRDFCGIVEVIGDGSAMVRITLRTKYILQETPIRNLLNLPNVPENRKVYYYGPMVDELFEELGEEMASALIAEDLHLDETMPTVEVLEEQAKAEEPKRHSRQRTVTALVKKLVLIEGKHNPLEIAKVVMQNLKSGEIKAPKNLFIIYCLPGETVMQGLVPFKASDGLISSNVLDLNGDSQNLTHHMTRPYKGQLVEISLSGNLPFKSTPEHELLVLRSKKNHKGQTWRPHWGASPKDVKESVPTWISAAEVLDSDFLLCPVKLPETSSTPVFSISSHYLTKPINTDIYPDTDLAWLFGLYIADGGKSGDRSTGLSLSICINKKTDRKRLVLAFSKLGIDDVKFDDYAEYCYARVNSVSLVSTFMGWFGEDCYTKHIPEFLYGWGEECLRSLIAGYAEGDGHAVVSHNGGHWATTVSYQLAYQVWYLLVALKCHPYISHYHDGEQTNFGPRSKSWMVWWTDTGEKVRHDTFYYGGYYCMPVKSVSLMEFDGNVHNFSVANTETYVANGVVAHNCIIKDRLMKDYFKKQDPELNTYRDVIHKHGKEFKFSANQIAKLDPDCKIPVLTQEVCKDGRSKEARKGKDIKEVAATEVKVVEKKTRGPKKRKKLGTDKCNTCYHERAEHKVTSKGSWGRCTGTSNHKIHSWVAKNFSGPCTCVRFKERATK